MKTFAFGLILFLSQLAAIGQSKKEQIEVLSQRIDSLNSVIVVANTAYSDLEKQKANDINKLNTEKEGLQQKLTTSESQANSLAELNKSKTDELSKVNAEKDGLQQKLNASETNATTLTETIARQLAELEQLKSSAQNLNQQIAQHLDTIKVKSNLITTTNNALTSSRSSEESLKKILATSRDSIRTLQQKISSTKPSNNFPESETAAVFNAAKQQIMKMVGTNDSNSLAVIFGFLDGKYGEYATSASELTLAIERGEDGSGATEVNIDVIKVNEKYIQVKFNESYQTPFGALGFSSITWLFNKETGWKVTWNELLLEDRVTGFSSLANGKLKALSTELTKCGIAKSAISEASIGEYDLNNMYFANGQLTLEYHFESDNVEPCPAVIKISLAEAKPFLDTEYFP